MTYVVIPVELGFRIGYRPPHRDKTQEANRVFCSGEVFANSSGGRRLEYGQHYMHTLLVIPGCSTLEDNFGAARRLAWVSWSFSWTRCSKLHETQLFRSFPSSLSMQQHYPSDYLRRNSYSSRQLNIWSPLFTVDCESSLFGRSRICLFGGYLVSPVLPFFRKE